MSCVIVIPARYASERLPGKPLLDIAGKPMLAHVHDRAASSGVGPVIVASDDERVAVAMRACGADVVLTSNAHRSGTDRIAEVVAARNLDATTVVVNVQGDEPLLPPELIRAGGGKPRLPGKSSPSPPCARQSNARTKSSTPTWSRWSSTMRAAQRTSRAPRSRIVAAISNPAPVRCRHRRATTGTSVCMRTVQAS